MTFDPPVDLDQATERYRDRLQTGVRTRGLGSKDWKYAYTQQSWAIAKLLSLQASGGRPVGMTSGTGWGNNEKRRRAGASCKVQYDRTATIANYERMREMG